MGRFTRKRKEHQVLGTDVPVYLEAMTALGSHEFRRSFTATHMPPVPDGEAPTEEYLEAAAEKQAAMIAEHTFLSPAGDDRAFSSAAEVRAELDAAQVEDLALAILDHSGFSAAAREAARRFRDGDGAAGGAPDRPDGEPVGNSAEPSADVASG